MRGIVTLALVLGLAGGLLGTIAFSEVSDRAGAVGYVTRQAEITLLADEATALGNSPRPDYQHTWGIATIATTTFPAGTTFRSQKPPSTTALYRSAPSRSLVTKRWEYYG